MNRLFGAKNAAPKPTLSSAISNVSLPSPPTYYRILPRLSSCFSPAFLFLFKRGTPTLLCAVPANTNSFASDRIPCRLSGRETSQTQRRALHLPIAHVENAGRTWENGAAAKSAQDPAATQNVRVTEGPAAAAVVEHGASVDDDRQPEECNDNR